MLRVRERERENFCKSVSFVFADGCQNIEIEVVCVFVLWREREFV